MHGEILEEIGLSPNEAKIYEALINLNEASVPTIARQTNIDKRNIYDAIPRLIKKGLLYQIADIKENKYAAIEPAKLSELIREKELRLETILPDLTKQFKKSVNNEVVYIYKGKEGIKNYLRDALKVGKDIYFVGAKGGWFDKDLEIFIKYFLKKALEKKMKYLHIFDAEVKNMAPDILKRLGKSLGKSYKFFPAKYSTSGGLAIFGDHIVTFSGLTIKKVSDDATITVIVNQALADCYRTWFKFMWDHCK